LTLARTGLGGAIMVDTPTSGPPIRHRSSPAAATAREARLAAALKANLRRRKTASKATPNAADREED
jgi:hypothetical protein